MCLGVKHGLAGTSREVCARATAAMTCHSMGHSMGHSNATDLKATFDVTVVVPADRVA
eukprot:CAMPEP_0182857010 /NCGR_PEP_ID=MMETSP0034_2-20130328/2794_1 /TAXON_ID=156128 /ORGANISM="Nephroselmis pyriformis, Strain CCMP717" /LENGTH=57 /DNA_ID=CAMNT_0024988187 /DNA_START=155 /DNA_END=325 /DNA_ORIENTATION=+